MSFVRDTARQRDTNTVCYEVHIFHVREKDRQRETGNFYFVIDTNRHRYRETQKLCLLSEIKIDRKRRRACLL